MATNIIKWLVTAVALLLLSTYFFLNYQKLVVLRTYWSDFNAGSTTPVVRIKLDEEVVYEYSLNTTDILDPTGKYQINIIPVPGKLFEKIGDQFKSSRLLIDKREFPLSTSGDKSTLLAVTVDRKIYLVADDTLKPMMTVIWNEQRLLENIIQCMTPDLCKTLLIASPHWGPLEGPFSDSEFSADRRALPRGRWILGPETSLNIQSGKDQRVRMEISLLAIHPDQEIRFQGPVSKSWKMETQASTLTAGGRLLTPSVFLVQLDLQSGNNELVISYSLWDKPVGKNAKPLAAYLTGIKVAKDDNSENQ